MKKTIALFCLAIVVLTTSVHGVSGCGGDEKNNHHLSEHGIGQRISRVNKVLISGLEKGMIHCFSVFVEFSLVVKKYIHHQVIIIGTTYLW